MYLVRIKKKSQITLPAAIMKEAGLQVGDYIEFVFGKGEISLHPKMFIDLQNNSVPNEAHVLENAVQILG